MDEALSSLDTENERLLQKSIKNLRRGRTTLIVAHRLSTFRDAGRLVVLNGGRVVETGTHAELIKKGGYTMIRTMEADLNNFVLPDGFDIFYSIGESKTTGRTAPAVTTGTYRMKLTSLKRTLGQPSSMNTGLGATIEGAGYRHRAGIFRSAAEANNVAVQYKIVYKKFLIEEGFIEIT